MKLFDLTEIFNYIRKHSFDEKLAKDVEEKTFRFLKETKHDLNKIEAMLHDYNDKWLDQGHDLAENETDNLALTLALRNDEGVFVRCLLGYYFIRCGDTIVRYGNIEFVTMN